MHGDRGGKETEVNQQIATLLIVLGMFILYLTERHPVALTTTLGMMAMVVTGVLSFNEAFACFGNTAVMLTLGMLIIVNSVLDSGIAAKSERLLSRLAGRSEKRFLLLVYLSAAFLSLFTTNSALVAVYMPFVTAVALASNGRITRKNIYLPMAMGSLIGGTGSLTGSTPPLLANNMLELNGQPTMRYFSTFPVAFAAVIVIGLCYWFFLYDLQKKWFDFEEVQPEDKGGMDEHVLDKRKMIISVTVFLTCIVLFIIQPFGWDLGFIAIGGAVILMVTGCVDGNHALTNMQWPALVTLGSALAVAKGFVSSGVAETIVNWMIRIMGSFILNPKIMVAVFLLLGWLLSQFMANGSLVTMLSAIAIPLAVQGGVNTMAVAMACVFGASMAMATPVATTSVTMVQVVGYRFRDYFRIGGLVGLIGVVTAWVSLMLIYGL